MTNKREKKYAQKKNAQKKKRRKNNDEFPAVSLRTVVYNQSNQTRLFLN